MSISKALAAAIVSLPAWACAAPAQSPSLACTATLEAYSPGSWYCDGSLTVSDGTLSGYESLILLAKDTLSLANVELKAPYILLNAATLSIDADSRIEAPGALTVGDNLLPSLDPRLLGQPLSSNLVIGTPQDDLTHIWYASGTITMQAGPREVDWPTLTLVPEPGAWQLALLGVGGLLLAARARRA